MSEKIIHLSDFCPKGDGQANDFDAFFACFSSAQRGDIIVIEPGAYLIDSPVSVPLCSGITVFAERAELYFPESLGKSPHRIMFYGEDIRDLKWSGGIFYGYVYNPASDANKWEPHACTKGIFIEGTDKCTGGNIRFEHISGKNVAGSVVGVYGYYDENSDLRYPIHNVDVFACSFENCGKFMWDYGYLWQRIVFPEYHGVCEVANAYRYMPPELMSGNVAFVGGCAEICVDRMPPPICKEGNTVSFFGDVPEGIVRGSTYFLQSVRQEGELCYITVGSTPDGSAVIPASGAVGSCRLFRNLFTVHHNLYAPNGAGTGKGPLDLSVCNSVKVSDCRMSASGDSMHIHRSHNVVFTGNHITGSRMGAFFIAQFCKNVTVSSNTVLGTNGSRTMSVEKSTEDITIVGNTFMGGGRGTWINQPYNIIIADNIFCKNTNKCTKDPHIGRLTPSSGGYECYPEIYFTTWEKDAVYGDVIMHSNIITTGDDCGAAVAFHNGGKNIIFSSNIIKGKVRDIFVGKGCEMPHMSDNIGVGKIFDEINEEKFDQ